MRRRHNIGAVRCCITNGEGRSAPSLCRGGLVATRATLPAAAPASTTIIRSSDHPITACLMRRVRFRERSTRHPHEKETYGRSDASSAPLRPRSKHACFSPSKGKQRVVAAHTQKESPVRRSPKTGVLGGAAPSPNRSSESAAPHKPSADVNLREKYTVAFLSDLGEERAL